MVKLIIFDFNKVLKDNNPSENFVPLVVVNKAAKDPKYNLIADEYYNQPLIHFVTTNQHRFKSIILSASRLYKLQLIKELLIPPFDDVLSAKETGLLKDDTQTYGKLSAMWQTKPANMLLIDDAPWNVAAAQQAGVQAILFTSTADCLRQLDKILAND